MHDEKTDEKAPAKGTTYRVYSAMEEEARSLTFVGQAHALNDQKAIAAVVGNQPTRQHYIAIPERNLRVRTATVVSEPKVVIA